MKRFLRRLLARTPRMPEGVPSQCPRCDAVICLEPTGSFGETTCPYCRGSLWFVQVLPFVLYYPSEEVSATKREKIAAVVKRWAVYAVSQPGFLSMSDLDSIELVEFVMELEKVLGVRLTPDAVRDMKSMADVIDFFVRECPD